ncbi:hypothetical protein T05_12400 [Trichinella murrelli]|uniref:Uncharacterized protein n=1 Tax=Trichinella murrelli TaxID=144512 RepID=A0A0V0TNT8_9BILA|nr:hypothetical protein T05_12400 [Trichinella murrelli]
MELYSALSKEYASFLFLLLLLKLHYTQRLLQYLGKYAFIGFWKVPMQTNQYLLNKLSLKFACAYTNTQESSEIDTLQKQRQYA